MTLSFDEERNANIARNQALLASLGLNNAAATMIRPRKAKPQPKPRAPKKRKTPPPASDNEDDNEGDKPQKVPRVESNNEAGGLRRSGRNAGKKINYADDSASAARNNVPRVISEKARERETEPRSVMVRTQDPKTHGSIPGISVGTWWETRQACSQDAIHAPWVAGISSGPRGAYSIALSGGYEDDVDIGEGFTFTGAGGRDLKGTVKNPKNLRTAPQSSDQDFTNAGNRALQRSVETRKPVRVIRGFKCPSPYAPAEGYRYDGLYTVEKAWREKGLNPGGWLVCKFLLKRIPGQPSLPIRGEEPESADGDTSDESTFESSASDDEDTKAESPSPSEK